MKTDKKIENKITTGKEKNISSKEVKDIDVKDTSKINENSLDVSNDEESLTPPLLPSMKLVNKDSLNNKDSEKKDNKDKNRKSEWDMFAEQDIFKTSTNVSIEI